MPRTRPPLTAAIWPTDPLGWLLAYCSRRLREDLATSFKGAGHKVSAEQWAILAQLWQGDGLSQQVLADRFHKSKVAAFHLVNSLEERGLVERRPNPDDGRSNLVHLTPKGRAMAGELVPLAQGTLDRAVDGICGPDLEQAKSVLYLIAANLTE